jgi:PAS domain S-box-containing protein
MGVDGIMSDTASLHVLLNNLVDRTRYPNGNVEFRYTLIAEEAVVSGTQMMARWTMSTTNAVALGAKREVKKMGMLCARFSSSHKIVALELMFDVMAFMLQLKQSSGMSSFIIIPNTVQTCTGCFRNSPMVLTFAERPYTRVQVNKEWEAMTGWTADEVVGKQSCKILQGEETEQDAVHNLTSSILYQRPDFCILTNYTRDRQKVFRNFFNVYPLSTDSKITHYVGLTVHIEWLETSEKLRKVNFTDVESKSSLEHVEVTTNLCIDPQDSTSASSGSGSDTGPTKVSASNGSSNDESSDDKKSLSPILSPSLGDIRN